MLCHECVSAIALLYGISFSVHFRCSFASRDIYAAFLCSIFCLSLTLPIAEFLLFLPQQDIHSYVQSTSIFFYVMAHSKALIRVYSFQMMTNLCDGFHVCAFFIFTYNWINGLFWITSFSNFVNAIFLNLLWVVYPLNESHFKMI